MRFQGDARPPLNFPARRLVSRGCRLPLDVPVFALRLRPDCHRRDMDRHRCSPLGVRHEGHIPGRRDGRNLDQAARTVENWLANQADFAVDLVEDADALRQVGVLTRAGAPSDEVNQAVRCARQLGWEWPPIALLLGETREQARQQLHDEQ